MLRMARQAGVIDVFHLRLALQPLGDAQRAVAVALHAQCQSANAAQRQEAAERIENAADRVLQETELFRQRRVIPHRRDARHHIGVAVKVFGGGVHHHVKAQSQRTLQIRRGEGVVRHADELMLFGDRGDGAQIRQLEQRVGRRFDPDHFGIRLDRLFQPGEIRRRHVSHAQAGGAAAHFFQQAVGAAVQVVYRDQVAVFIEQLQHRGAGRQTGGEGVAAAAAFQFGDGAFQRGARRVGAAGVFVAGMFARRRLGVGGGGVNRRHHCAGRVRGVTGVNGQRIKLGHNGSLLT